MKPQTRSKKGAVVAVDGAALRRERVKAFPSIQAMNGKTMISKAALVNVERGFGRTETVDAYCAAIGVEATDYILSDELMLAPPATINMRPIAAPDIGHKRWLANETAIVLCRYRISCPPRGVGRVRITSVRLESPQIADRFGEPIVYERLYWVSLDNARSLQTHPELSRDSLWRGEVEYRGSGSTVHDFDLSPGEDEAHEMMLKARSGPGPTWGSLLDRTADLEKSGMDFTMSVTFKTASGREGHKKCRFRVEGSYFERLKTQNPAHLTYGIFSNLQPNVKDLSE
ncbi:MAG: hypothetical protein ABTQ31_03225 [Rhizobiaceae bacterium]